MIEESTNEKYNVLVTVRRKEGSILMYSVIWTKETIIKENTDGKYNVIVTVSRKEDCKMNNVTWAKKKQLLLQKIPSNRMITKCKNIFVVSHDRIQAKHYKFQSFVRLSEFLPVKMVKFPLEEEGLTVPW